MITRRWFGGGSSAGFIYLCLGSCIALALVALTAGCGSVRCVTVGAPYEVTFTIADGTEKTAKGNVASLNVRGKKMGQCGSGWWATNWTEDCLIHDACHNYAMDHEGDPGVPKECVGGLGPNCGDEMRPAWRDYFAFGKCKGRAKNQAEAAMDD